MKNLIAIGFFIAAVINLAPGVGLLSNEWLYSLYGVEGLNGDLSLLLRHRAVLFVIVGGLLLTGVFVERVRLITGLAGLASMCSFIVLYVTVPETGAELKRVMYVDIAGAVPLAVALIIHIVKTR